MARSRKYTDEKRVFIVRVRLTQAEKSRLVEAAAEAGLTLSDFMRVKTIAAVPLIRKATPMRAELILGLGQLGKIGSNINQIARALNRKDENPAVVPMPVIVQALRNIDMLTIHLIQLVEHGH